MFHTVSPAAFLLMLFLALATLISAGPMIITSRATPPDVPGSNKRGVAYNREEYVQYFNVQDTRVGWAYNWAQLTKPTNTPFEYVAMLWDNSEGSVSKWNDAVTRSALAQPNDPTHLLGFNEPDNCEPGMGGACMKMADTVGAWWAYMEPAKKLKEKMYLGSPAVTNGDGPMGLTYLRTFLDQCKGCNVDFICVHWYDDATNFAYFMQHMEEVRKVANGRPIWLTEFAAKGSNEQIKAFLNQAIPYLDNAKDVHRYAYFMAQRDLLINSNGDGLSEIGKHYVHWQSKNTAGQGAFEGSEDVNGTDTA